MIAETREIEIKWPKAGRVRIFPVFLPNWGCAKRCAFCSQEAQTGRKASLEELDRILAECRGEIERSQASGHAAFYGGTFSSLPDSVWKKCLNFAKSLKRDGLIEGFRFSTRPDSLSERRLIEALEAGCKLVEFGAQSFDDSALAASGRGCDGRGSRRGPELCSAFQVPFGVHLMPGLPGSSHEIFLNDARVALDLKASCLRVHPCLVLKGTRLEREWREGRYRPLAMDETLEIVARAWVMASERGVPVIRVGVAPEDVFLKSILAGPFCPSMGSRVQGRALLKIVESRLGERERIVRMILPRRVSGFLFGKKGELAPRWRALNVDKTNIEYGEGDAIRIIAASADDAKTKGNYRGE